MSCRCHLATSRHHSASRYIERSLWAAAWRILRRSPTFCRLRSALARFKYVLAYPWGAPRCVAAALSYLPACAPSPLAARNLQPLCSPAAALPRPSDCRYPSGRGSARSVPSRANHCGERQPSPALSLRTCALRYAPRTPRKQPNHARAPCA